MDRERPAELRLKYSTSPLRQAIETGEPLFLTSEDADYSIKLKTGYLVRSLLYVPLYIQDRPLGLLGVTDKVGGQAFTPGRCPPADLPGQLCGHRHRERPPVWIGEGTGPRRDGQADDRHPVSLYHEPADGHQSQHLRAVGPSNDQDGLSAITMTLGATCR